MRGASWSVSVTWRTQVTTTRSPTTTEEIASEMLMSKAFIQPLLMELHAEGKVMYQQKSQPRRKFVLLWRAS